MARLGKLNGSADHRSNISEGFITASWNNWLEGKTRKREIRLAGVPVGARLEYWVTVTTIIRYLMVVSKINLRKQEDLY